MVLAYDPVGQGERRQYWNPVTGQTEASLGPVYEHSMPGLLLLLLGENLSAYRIWDGMRAIDYLLTRPEVDGQRIGCAGHSGGGTLTLFISALDERVRCAVVNEGGTGHRWPLRAGPGPFPGPGTRSRIFCRRRFMELTAVTCMWPSHHVRCWRLQRISRPPSTAPRTTFAIATGCWAFRRSSPPKRPPIRMPIPETATGDHRMVLPLVLQPPGSGERTRVRGGTSPQPVLHAHRVGALRTPGDTIFSLILKKQAELPPQPAPPATRTEWETWKRGLLSQVAEVLRYRPVTAPLAVRPLVTTARKGYRVEKLEFLSEPGIYVPTWVFEPEKRIAGSRAILYVNDAGVAEEGAEGMELGVLAALARKGHLVVAVEPAGQAHNSTASEGGTARILAVPAALQPGYVGGLAGLVHG